MADSAFNSFCTQKNPRKGIRFIRLWLDSADHCSVLGFFSLFNGRTAFGASSAMWACSRKDANLSA